MFVEPGHMATGVRVGMHCGDGQGLVHKSWRMQVPIGMLLDRPRTKRQSLDCRYAILPPAADGASAAYPRHDAALPSWIRAFDIQTLESSTRRRTACRLPVSQTNKQHNMRACAHHVPRKAVTYCAGLVDAGAMQRGRVHVWPMVPTDCVFGVLSALASLLCCSLGLRQ